MIKVEIVPGSAFCEEGEGFARLSIADSDNDIDTGLREIVNWADGQNSAI